MSVNRAISDRGVRRVVLREDIKGGSSKWIGEEDSRQREEPLQGDSDEPSSQFSELGVVDERWGEAELETGVFGKKKEPSLERVSK